MCSSFMRLRVAAGGTGKPLSARAPSCDQRLLVPGGRRALLRGARLSRFRCFTSGCAGVLGPVRALTSMYNLSTRASSADQPSDSE